MKTFLIFTLAVLLGIMILCMASIIAYWAYFIPEGFHAEIEGDKVIIKRGEQKPAETVKWSPQEESCIYQLESLVKEQWRQADKVHNSVNIKKMSELMFFLKTLNPNKKPQRIISAEAKEALYDKPAWSEEDSFRTETLISVIKSGGSIRPELRNEFVNWLKSLKGRIGG